MLPHPVGPAIQQRPEFFFLNLRGQFEAEVVDLHLLFQMNERQPAVIPADAKLFPFLHPVQLFPQGLVPKIVKINAADLIDSPRPDMGVRLHHRPQP